MGGLNREKIFALARGFRGRGNNVWRISKLRVEKALQHAFRGRKEKKRHWRSLWIERINAATREHQMSYSQFMHKLPMANIQLDRKVLSQLAMTEPFSFQALVQQVQRMRGVDGRSSQ
mmetsp:Transcript_21274/g.36229  ORF Transcript_21274/g.36229 Transcript_21274/m.36229 type:complete len:118 (+) Transcript_21274:58-411(+)|eukprot:CAMPEP_0119112654 /NCGR_PEP_ID=MMETSP1180-20130426/41109_1 /TAXON_ID=3052 ORGANISM="Chlamydomonas cf sp, Strain CCMP681" /NCGR_SAMPLE_ID=MMETSP1180 /ASSEMBLY_ACC=CAM_ASM_000741 /LENGTH=117 /DNA_ID=CAMNT_0007100261 /DNA_START=46 /DNA_END=399 /DNA_ORIENTATION=+